MVQHCRRRGGCPVWKSSPPSLPTHHHRPSSSSPSLFWHQMTAYTQNFLRWWRWCKKVPFWLAVLVRHLVKCSNLCLVDSRAADIAHVHDDDVYDARIAHSDDDDDGDDDAGIAHIQLSIFNHPAFHHNLHRIRLQRIEKRKRIPLFLPFYDALSRPKTSNG